MDTLLTFLQKKYLKQLDCKLRFLLNKYSVEEIVNEIMEWLKSENLNYFDTTLFARDFYIGSDLTQEERDDYYSELQRQNFFQQLNNFLYSDNFSVCSWTIYTIGKFSNSENAKYLETAYETSFRLINPILSYRCLNELRWLSSQKLEYYLQNLKADNSITSKLTLLYYWQQRSYSSELKDLHTDNELIAFISANQTLIDIEEEIRDRLYSFEHYVSLLYNSTKKSLIDKNEFASIAKTYFDNYTKTVDEQLDKDHLDFLDQLSKEQ